MFVCNQFLNERYQLFFFPLYFLQSLPTLVIITSHCVSQNITAPYLPTPSPLTSLHPLLHQFTKDTRKSSVDCEIVLCISTTKLLVHIETVVLIPISGTLHRKLPLSPGKNLTIIYPQRFGINFPTIPFHEIYLDQLKYILKHFYYSNLIGLAVFSHLHNFLKTLSSIELNQILRQKKTSNRH